MSINELEVRTLKQAKEILKDTCMSIRKLDGEYRVNFRDGFESTAYYTNDLNDAVGTALNMATYQ